MNGAWSSNITSLGSNFSVTRHSHPLGITGRFIYAFNVVVYGHVDASKDNSHSQFFSWQAIAHTRINRSMFIRAAVSLLIGNKIVKGYILVSVSKGR